MEALQSEPPPTNEVTNEVTNKVTNEIKEVTNEIKEVTKEIKEDLSYEEEQLQQILIQESERLKIIMDRELREQQEFEYLASLLTDTEKQKGKEFYEPSIEEVRRKRLERFNDLTIKD